MRHRIPPVRAKRRPQNRIHIIHTHSRQHPPPTHLSIVQLPIIRWYPGVRSTHLDARGTCRQRHTRLLIGNSWRAATRPAAAQTRNCTVRSARRGNGGGEQWPLIRVQDTEVQLFHIGRWELRARAPTAYTAATLRNATSLTSSDEIKNASTLGKRRRRRACVSMLAAAACRSGAAFADAHGTCDSRAHLPTFRCSAVQMLQCCQASQQHQPCKPQTRH
jgi:hypothetical protein